MTLCKRLPVLPSSERGETADLELSLDVAPTFVLGAEHKSYRHQFATLYFARLLLLKKVVEEKARQRWRGSSGKGKDVYLMAGTGESHKDYTGSPPLVPRVLDVVRSQVCFIVGTVYLDMPQKPNVLEDIGRDRSLPEPPIREKYLSAEDMIVLEDDSGRVQLVGDALSRVIDDGLSEVGENSHSGFGNLLVSGIIMAALGRETSEGAFEVKDVCFPGMGPMLFQNPSVSARMDLDGSQSTDEWIAIVSGLEMDEDSASDPRIQMLVEYITGEGGAQEDSTPRISRLIIAGDSLTPPVLTDNKPPVVESGPKAKRFGQEASNFSPAPTNTLGDFLYDVVSALPVHLLPGAKDPSSTLLPQQALPRAMFDDVKGFRNFSCETNPTWLGFESKSASSRQANIQRFLYVHSGQAVDDMFKYVASPPASRLDLACATLRWRHVAPTAPDTLWCYPYLTTDPFVLRRTPDIYVVGCQPEFATRLVSSNDFGDDSEQERRCRVILVPAFKKSGCLVLVNMQNLDVKCMEFGLSGCLKNAPDAKE